MPKDLIVFVGILSGIGFLVLLINWRPRRKDKPAMQRFDAVAAWEKPSAPVEEKPAPAPAVAALHPAAVNYHSMTVAVVLPIMQALITATIFGVAAFVLALIFKAAALLALQIAGGIFVLTLAWVWLSRQSGWLHAIHRIESTIGMDLDGDGVEGEPEPQPAPGTDRRLTVDHVMHAPDGSTTGQTSRVYDATPEQLTTLAIGILLRGQAFTEDVWGGGGKVFSKPGLARLRQQFIEDGLLQPKGKGSTGYEFSQKGTEFLLAILEQYSPQTLAEFAPQGTPLPS